MTPALVQAGCDCFKRHPDLPTIPDPASMKVGFLKEDEVTPARRRTMTMKQVYQDLANLAVAALPSRWVRRRKFFVIAAAILATPGFSEGGGAIEGELFYTRYSGSPNVKSVPFTYDGSSNFYLGAPISIGTTNGADGVAHNPQNTDLLIVGGQGPRVNLIHKRTGAASSFPCPVAAYHLEVVGLEMVFAAGIPGPLARHPILSDGTLGEGVALTLTGDDRAITQLISTPDGFRYTKSDAGGIGSYGVLVFKGDPAKATSAELERVHVGLPAAHGGVYDPFSGDVIVFGDTHVTQLDLAGNIVSDLDLMDFPGVTPEFDQGTVDGEGHLFAASNTGHLLFVDYSASGVVNDPSNFVDLPFLDTNLDDIAPLVGPGGATALESTTWGQVKARFKGSE